MDPAKNRLPELKGDAALVVAKLSEMMVVAERLTVEMRLYAGPTPSICRYSLEMWSLMVAPAPALEPMADQALKERKDRAERRELKRLVAAIKDAGKERAA